MGESVNLSLAEKWATKQGIFIWRCTYCGYECNNEKRDHCPSCGKWRIK